MVGISIQHFGCFIALSLKPNYSISARRMREVLPVVHPVIVKVIGSTCHECLGAFKSFGEESAIKIALVMTCYRERVHLCKEAVVLGVKRHQFIS